MPTEGQSSMRREEGSFRDPDSRVFYAGNEVYRALTAAGLADFQAVAATGLLDDTRIVRTALVDAPDAGMLADDVTAVLVHERIPFVSYPYEWTFSMLKDAALLQLDLLLAALEHDLILKDSSPYNIQFVGSQPVFIDIGSFERLREAELWVGYRQFCMLFLYPLLLQATKGVAFQPLLRGSIDGISPTQMRSLMSFRDRFRRGYLTNVFLQARWEKRPGAGKVAMGARLDRPGVGKRIIQANVRKMRARISKLDWSPPDGVWIEYGGSNSYTEEDAARKDAFVRAVATSQRWPLIWDIGCNNGRHARLLAEQAGSVIAIDADPGPVDLLYRELRRATDTTILALTMNVADPSPGLGWRGLERKPMAERGCPDLVVALAVVHHVSITANVPIKDVVDWWRSIGGAVLVEFPTREDSMVQALLARKRPGLHGDYSIEHFESCLADAFDIRRREVLGSGTRVLYFATPRGS